MSEAPRPAGAELAAAMAALHARSFGEAWEEAAIRELLAMPGTLALALGQAPALSGFVMLRIGGGEAEILTICTGPECRRAGLGRRLLDAAAAHAMAAGAEALFLEVAEDNEAALRLYESAGFYLVGMRPGYYRREGAPVAARTLKLDLPAPPNPS